MQADMMIPKWNESAHIEAKVLQNIHFLIQQLP